MDIVERLRNLVILDEVGSNNSLANEAADMIEALRKDLDFSKTKRTDYALLGGDRSNPGVWGHGGGAIVRSVCAHCGRYRVVDTWAQNPSTGEQGLRSVQYEDADDESQHWLRVRRLEALSRRLEAAEAVYECRLYADPRRDDDGEIPRPYLLVTARADTAAVEYAGKNTLGRADTSWRLSWMMARYCALSASRLNTIK